MPRFKHGRLHFFSSARLGRGIRNSLATFQPRRKESDPFSSLKKNLRSAIFQLHKHSWLNVYFPYRNLKIATFFKMQMPVTLVELATAH